MSTNWRTPRSCGNRRGKVPMVRMTTGKPAARPNGLSLKRPRRPQVGLPTDGRAAALAVVIIRALLCAALQEKDEKQTPSSR